MHGFDLTDFGAAVGDVAPLVQAARLGQLHRDLVVPDSEQQIGQSQISEYHDRTGDHGHHGEDGQLDQYPPRQMHV